MQPLTWSCVCAQLNDKKKLQELLTRQVQMETTAVEVAVERYVEMGAWHTVYVNASGVCGNICAFLPRGTARSWPYNGASGRWDPASGQEVGCALVPAAGGGYKARLLC